MPQWVKLIQSGSAAELSSLTLDNPLTVPNGGTGLSSVTSGFFLRGNGTGNLTEQGFTGTGNVVLTDGATVTNFIGSGSFSGSFEGDGSGLTGITSAGVSAAGSDTQVQYNSGGSFSGDAGFTYNDATNVATIGGTTVGAAVSVSSTLTIGTLNAGSSDDVLVDDGTGTVESRAIDSRVWGSSLVDGSGAATRIAYWSDSNTLTSDVDMTFTAGSNTLTVNGTTVSSTIDVQSTLIVGQLTTGTNSNSVIIDGGSGLLKSRTIDSKVWGGSLIDGSGAATRVAYWSDADTLTSDADMTFDGTTLTVNGSTFSQDVTVAGNLTVLGDTITANVANLLVEDRFILLNSGSTTGDGGIIVQSAAGGGGVSIGWDDSEGRFGAQVTSTLAENATTMSPDSYLALAVSGSGTDIEHQKLGNIRTEGGEIYVWA